MAEGMKRLKIIITSLREQGAVVEPKTNGYFVKFPNGDTTILHTSDSDHRAEMNTRSRVKRAGLEWPFDKHKKGNGKK